MLRDFIAEHRDEILMQARSRVATRNAPVATEAELTHGLPAFLDQLCEALRRASSLESADHANISTSAGVHGDERYSQGLTVGQVVHDYGDLCQIVTGLAVKQNAQLAADEEAYPHSMRRRPLSPWGNSPKEAKPRGELSGHW